MYRTQKSLALQKKASEVVPSATTEVSVSKDSGVQPVGTDLMSKTDASPAKTTTTPIVEQLRSAIISPVKVPAASPVEELTVTAIPAAKVAMASSEEKSTSIVISPTKDTTTTSSMEKSTSIVISPTKDTTTSSMEKSKSTDSFPTETITAPPVKEPTIPGISLTETATTASSVQESPSVATSPSKAAIASTMVDSSSVSIPSTEAATTSPLKESTVIEQQKSEKSSTEVITSPGQNSDPDIPKQVPAMDQVSTAEESCSTSKSVEPPEQENDMLESKSKDADQSITSKDVSKQTVVADSSSTNTIPKESVPEEDRAPIAATPTPEKKRGRGRPRKVPKEDRDLEKEPEPVREKEPTPPPVTPDLASPGIRKSQRARKSKFSADHSDYVSGITPQKTPKIRTESPRVDTRSSRVDVPVGESPAVVDTPVGKSPKVDTPVTKSAGGDTPVAKSPAVGTPVGESPGDVVVKRKRGRPRKNSVAPPLVPETPPAVVKQVEEAPVEEPKAEEDTPRRGGSKKSRKTVPRKVPRGGSVVDDAKKLEKEELLSEISAISNVAPLRKVEDPLPPPPPPPAEEAACRCAELTLPLKKRKHQKGVPEKRCPHAGTPACSRTSKSPPHKKKVREFIYSLCI
ncbi:proteoglycan 4-like [Uloborus diversus]|uniref:proteoglycan 4-like n=1 Tax=Uloborus diversus TaxID=327109 RepID=UPI0024092D39|nr:proteoglycan 4-like [Uloborus diversus]